jgi:quercetin dioxygenase-like cupin family protein
MGRISSLFKADGAETGRAYSVSEWWLEPNTKGSPNHANPEEHAWFVIEGTMTILVGKTWREAPIGSFVLIPGGTMHGFENRSRARAGILSFNIPGGFEDRMPGISKALIQDPPGKVTR